MSLSFPVSTQQLSNWLPHRAPALWVDEVISVNATDGVCRVHLLKSGNYANSNGQIRESSFVEWMAQSYGFIYACQALTGLVPSDKKPEKAFLVQIRDLELSDTPVVFEIVEGDYLDIHVKKTHQLGPIALVEGTVLSSDGSVLARGKLKLFAE